MFLRYYVNNRNPFSQCYKCASNNIALIDMYYEHYICIFHVLNELLKNEMVLIGLCGPRKDPECAKTGPSKEPERILFQT